MRVTPACDSINSIDVSSANGVQMMPDVAFDNSNYMVVWSDYRISNRVHIYGARVTPEGTVIDPNGILIGPDTETLQFEPSITFTGTRFFVVWSHHSASFAVAGRFVNCDGSLGDTIRIANIVDEAYKTDVAYDGSNFLVVWTQYPGFLKGQRVSNDGTLMGTPFIIATNVTTLGSGSLCFDGNNYMVVYTMRNGDIYEVWGRQYDTSGNPLGPAFIISNPANSSYDSYIVAGDTNYLNVWTHMDYPFDIYGNVDVTLGIDEGNIQIPPDVSRYLPTLMRNPLHLPAGMEWRVFDILGREVSPRHMKPGIYFLEHKGQIVQKIIKVR